MFHIYFFLRCLVFEIWEYEISVKKRFSLIIRRYLHLSNYRKWKAQKCFSNRCDNSKNNGVMIEERFFTYAFFGKMHHQHPVTASFELSFDKFLYSPKKLFGKNFRLVFSTPKIFTSNYHLIGLYFVIRFIEIKCDPFILSFPKMLNKKCFPCWTNLATFRKRTH